MLGVDWHRVKHAIEHRRKLDKEDADADMPGGYKRVSRKRYFVVIWQLSSAA
jgi:hypothetical protein